MKVPQIASDLGAGRWGDIGPAAKQLNVRTVILLYPRRSEEPIGASLWFSNEPQLTILTWFDTGEVVEAWSGGQRACLREQEIGRRIYRYECYQRSCTGEFYFSHKDRM